MMMVLRRLFLKAKISVEGSSKTPFLLLAVLAAILLGETLRAFFGLSAVLSFYWLALLLMIDHIFNFSPGSLIITVLFSLFFCVLFLALGAISLADQLSSLSYIFLSILALKQLVTLLRTSG